MSEIPVVADCDRKFTLRAFFHLVVNRRPRMFITIHEEGNRNRLRCEVLQKSVVEQRQVSIRQSIWIRIDRIRYIYASMFSADEERNARYEDSGRETRIGRYYEKGIIPGCGAGVRRTGLRGSVYSERMALCWWTTIIIRSYWIIALHLAIP